MSNTTVRAISGFFYVLILFLGTTSYGSYLLSYISGYNLIVFQGNIFYGLILFLFVGTFLETAWFMKFDNKFFILVSLLVGAIPFYIFSNYFFNESFYFGSQIKDIIKNLLFVFLFIIAIVIIFKYPEELYMDTSKLIFLCTYIAIPFSLTLIIPEIEKRTMSFSSEIFYVFLLIWSSDTFAFIFGKIFGKRKLAPSISPGKTVEGLLGGIICTILLGGLIQLYSPNLKGNWMVLGLMISIFAPIGDLAASKLKRHFKIKDSGFLIPGHGGLLDRLDSFIACIPFIFLYYIFINY